MPPIRTALNLACFADRLLAARWETGAEALTYGAPLDHVAAALGLEPDEVDAGVRSSVTGQLQLNRETGGQLGITAAEHDEVLAFSRRTGDIGGSPVGARRNRYQSRNNPTPLHEC